MYFKIFICFLLPIFTCTLVVKSQFVGCTDAAANNFNNMATVNSCACLYNAEQITPTLKYECNTILNEISGQILIDNKLYAINDGGGAAALYELDTNNNSGIILRTINIINATNVDWEDITQDANYIYIGDFGNNLNGARTDLKIYKLNKTDVLNNNNVVAQIINFSYSDQIIVTSTTANNTNFDCEAMIARGDSLFLFSKNWVDKKTKLYKLPKIAGTFLATYINEWDIQTLVTGATLINNEQAILLTTYDNIGNENIALLYGFTTSNFFNCTKRLISVNEGLFNFHQIESIANINNYRFFVSNELRTTPYPIIGNVTTTAKIRTVDLTPYLQPYYSILSSGIWEELFISQLNCSTINIKTKNTADNFDVDVTIEISEDGKNFISNKELNKAEIHSNNIMLNLNYKNTKFLRTKMIHKNKIIYSNIYSLPVSNFCNVTKNNYEIITTNNSLLINMKNNSNHNKVYAIYNSVGLKILQGKFKNNNSIVNIENLPRGIYFFNFLTTNSTNQHKFLKQ